jgi:geranylgeranyl reductase family protein
MPSQKPSEGGGALGSRMSNYNGACQIDHNRYDVIIVGAGPAGCSAATFLAKNDYHVLLVDRAQFPRDKVCGDGIGPPALDVLERMGILEKIENSQPWRIDGIDFFSPAGRMLRTNFQHVEGLRKQGYVLPRKDFDFVLLQHVRGISNVVVLENCETTDLMYNGNRVSGIRVEHENWCKEFSGKVVIGADGVFSLIGRKHFSLNSNYKHMALGARAYFNNVEGLDHYIEIHCDKALLPGYGWVFPMGEGRANVGVGASYRFATRGKNMKRLFDIFLNQNRYMKRKFHKAHMIEGSFKGWPIPLGSRPIRRSHKNVLLIGDAGSFADTVTGEGIYYALRSGEYAAQAVAMGLNNSTERIGDNFENLWRKDFRRREYLLGYLIQRVLFNEFFLNFNIDRALKNQKMAEALVDILCHKKSKLKLLF